ncbi:MAG: hypothetical protein ACYDAL_06305 [Candidatus Dormibacteraceae bacterium]
MTDTLISSTLGGATWPWKPPRTSDARKIAVEVQSELFMIALITVVTWVWPSLTSAIAPSGFLQLGHERGIRTDDLQTHPEIGAVWGAIKNGADQAAKDFCVNFTYVPTSTQARSWWTSPTSAMSST